MRADFQKTYGYDPQPYLPSIYGRVVGSADATERFLWDLRRLVAERIARDYVGGLRDLAHAKGMKLWLENYGHFGFPSEFLLYGAYTDEVGGEFWLGRNHNTVEIRAASSAARIYGKSPVWAEAFTSRNLTFQTAPRDLKAQGDWAFSQGINQFVLHVYIHQSDEKLPGINAWFGT
ncbi:MAG: glycoside hydrolase family 2, partial [Verrucomicrobia bacterium]|nr:glycoside hydrolase family 2 [Verrucomicrobiota bacterium]